MMASGDYNDINFSVQLNNGTHLRELVYEADFLSRDEYLDADQVDGAMVRRIKEVIENGIRHIAACQGTELEVGMAIKELFKDSKVEITRAELEVSTTVSASDDVRASLQQSLRRLGLDYVDLYVLTPANIVDADDDEQDHFIASWKAMEDVYGRELRTEDRKARAIGVSSFYGGLADVLDLTRKEVKPIVPAVYQVDSLYAIYPPTVPNKKRFLEVLKSPNVRVQCFGHHPERTRNHRVFSDQLLDNILKGIRRECGMEFNASLMHWQMKQGASLIVRDRYHNTQSLDDAKTAIAFFDRDTSDKSEEAERSRDQVQKYFEQITEVMLMMRVHVPFPPEKPELPFRILEDSE